MSIDGNLIIAITGVSIYVHGTHPKIQIAVAYYL